jgi:hypothetical protein
MKSFTALAIAASFFLGAQASPVEVEERGISAKVTLCSRPNLQDCDTTYIPIDTCCKCKLQRAQLCIILTDIKQTRFLPASSSP